jgi:hypothetical protein
MSGLGQACPSSARSSRSPPSPAPVDRRPLLRAGHPAEVRRGPRRDYLSRLNYIEPKLTKAEEQNRILLELHNPAEQIKALATQEQTNHDRTVALLRSRSRRWQIESKMPRSEP